MISIQELRIAPRGDAFRSFAGQPQTFVPGEENDFVINPPVDFVNRVADVTAVLDYSFNLQRETGSGALLSCSFTVPEFPDEPGTAFVIRVNEEASAGSAVGFVGAGEMLLVEGIDRQYDFVCRIADPASLDALAEAPIQVTQRYEPIDTIRIVSADPPASEPLAPGTTQTFAATVEYTRDVIRLGSQAMLVATDAAGNELVPRNERRQNSSAQQATGDGPNPVQISLTLADVPVPDDGIVFLYAEQLNGNQFGDFQSAAYATYNTSAPLVYGGDEAGPDFSIRHIEINQAVQDDDNLVPLVADRPAVARVFVTTSAPLVPGENTEPQLTVTLRHGGEEHVVSGLAIAAISTPDNALFSLRNTRSTATEVRVPQSFTGEGELEIEAAVNLQDGEAIEPEADTSNNTLRKTFRFFERDTLLIGYVAVSSSARLDLTSYVRKLFPVSPTRGLALVPFGTTWNAENFTRAMAEASMAASSGLIDVAVVSADGDLGYDFRIVSAAVISGLINAPVLPLERPSARSLAAALAARLLRTNSLGDGSACPSAVDGDFAAVGWDVEQSQLVRLDQYIDLWPGCEHTPNMWISASRYSRLFLRDFGAQPAALRAGGKRQGAVALALVSGKIRSDGSASLSPVIHFPGATAPPLENSGEYCLEFRGLNGMLSHCMTPSFGSFDALPFAIVVPGDAASNGVSLTRNGAEVASLTPSASAPAVAITSPSAGAAIDADPALPLAWTASDADGGPLSASIFYSSDGGATWAPLAANREGDTYDVDTTRIRGGEQVFLRVVVSDGLRTAQDDVGPLTLRQAPAIDVAESFDLGEGAAGVTRTVPLTIASAGTGPLRITAAEFNNAAFEAASAVPLELLPGTSGELVIGVTPPSTGVHSATLTLETNADPSAVTVQLSVRGLDPEQPILDAITSGDTVDFPETPQNGLSQAAVSLVNRGKAALAYQPTVEGEGFSLAPASAAASTGAPAQEVTLQPNQQQDLIVEFSPPRTGNFAGALRITSNAPNASQRTIALSGSGVEASTLPAINAGGIVDAASFQPGLAHGGIASLFGTSLSSQTEAASQTPLPTSLAGARVLVDGVAAPLFFVSPNQINFQMPFEAARDGAAQVSVENAGVRSAAAPAVLAPYSPAVFANPATGEPIVTRPDGSLITAASPARPGDALILYVTGIGDLNNSPASGAPAAADPLSQALVLPQVTVAGAPVHVFFAGLTPEFVGLGQINIQLPAELAGDGGTASLVIDFDGQTSTPVDLPVAGLQ